jgi:hypothetical protein
LDGWCDHRETIADEALQRHAIENIAEADALLFGRAKLTQRRDGTRQGLLPFGMILAEPSSSSWLAACTASYRRFSPGSPLLLSRPLLPIQHSPKRLSHLVRPAA